MLNKMFLILKNNISILCLDLVNILVKEKRLKDFKYPTLSVMKI